ncbi:MAG: DUF554 domain-containing protein [Bacteroidales bacterium]|nr:DUF554 domain-containing protein [Bacteroidales bacterium]
MIGTLVNVAAIIVGSAVGALIRSRLPQKYIDTAFQCAGLITMIIGISMALKSDRIVLIVISLIVGAIIGVALNLDGNTEKAANYLLKKFAKKDSNSQNSSKSRLAIEGFITTSVLFCTGSMAILGAFEDGMGQTPNLLYTKSVIDGFASIAFASSFGIFVAFSAIPVLIYQGALTLLTVYLMQFMNDAMIADLTAVGGILLFALGINIMRIKEIKVINFLPALIVIVVLSGIFS